MKRTLCLLPLLLAAPVYCADNSDLVNLLPSDTQVAFGIKVHSVLNSELAKNLTAEMKGQAGDLQKLIALSGFDPMTDLDEILIGSTGAGEKPPTLIVARGKFDVEKLTPNAELYNGVRLVTSQNPQAPGVYGFLDEMTAIAGDPETVKAMIDHRGDASTLEAKLASQIAEYRDHYDIWAIVNRPEGLTKYMPKTNRAAAGLDSIDHFQFGLSVQRGLDLAAEVHARTAKDAEQLATTMQFLDAMTKASPSASKGTQFAFNKSDDGTLKVTLAVSEEELMKGIEQQRKAGLQWGLTPSGAQPKAAEATAPRTVSAQPVLPPVAQEKAPVPVQAAPKRVAPGVGGDDGHTAVFKLPSPQ
jgi:hypothetical protein